MIFIYLGLLFFFVWWLADKSLKDNFLAYLKWPSLAFIVILVATDIFLFIETERFFKAKEIGGDNGIAYSYFNNTSNTTVQHTMFAKQDEDSGTIMTYHYIEYWAMQDIVGMLPYIAILVAVTFAIQYIYLGWKNSYYGPTGLTKEKDDKKGI